MRITILVAEDQQIIREGLVSLLSQRPDMSVVGEAENGREAVRLAQELVPDVIVMDVTMPDLNGIEATQQILHHLPSVKVIALSGYDDRQYIIGMLHAGAKAYILKDRSFKELVQAINEVMSGRMYLSPSITSVVVGDYMHLLDLSGVVDPISMLTSREREILQLLAEGRSTKEIANKVFLNQKTVETHRRHIMEKLQINTLADLVKYAIHEGIIRVDR